MDSVTFIKSFPLKRFSRGELLLAAGDMPKSVYILQEGFVKVESVTADMVQRFLWVAGRYDIVPSEKLFSLSRHIEYDYTALTDGAAYSVDKARFLEAAKTHNTLMGEIARGMSEHYDDVLYRLNSIEQASVRSRLIHTLHNLAMRFGAGGTVDLSELGLTLTHQDLAHMIGSTRETTSLEMTKLRRDGTIYYSRDTLIIYGDKTAELVQD